MSVFDPIDLEAARRAKEDRQETALRIPASDIQRIGEFCRKVESIYAMLNCDNIEAAEAIASVCRRDPALVYAREIFSSALEKIQACKITLRNRAKERGEE